MKTNFLKVSQLPKTKNALKVLIKSEKVLVFQKGQSKPKSKEFILEVWSHFVFLPKYQKEYQIASAYLGKSIIYNFQSNNL